MTFNEGIEIDPGRASGGGGRGRTMAVGGGIGGVIVAVLAVLLSGGSGEDAIRAGTSALQEGGAAQDPAAPAGTESPFAQCTSGAAANEDVSCRIIATMESLDAVWQQQLPTIGATYTEPGLNIFTSQVSTGCGAATSAVGPFYCPADATAYFDTSFFDVLVDRFGSSGGPLAQEYVVAHEVGHHISNVLGVLGRAQEDPEGAESGAVRTELQADCYAGLWAHYAVSTPDPQTGQTFLKPLTDKDIADALSAASAVGDDRIQQAATGRVNPEGWTHGSSAQRQYWFTMGYEQGRIDACDTFSATDLGG